MRRAAGEARGQHEILLAQRQEAAAHLAAERRPADQRQDHGDGEEHLDRRPVARQGGRQCQPDRDGRHRLQQLDQALDHLVGLAADIARDAAQHDAQDDGERHRDEADRHRGLGAVHDARPLVPAEPVGAQQEDALRWDRPVRSDAGWSRTDRGSATNGRA